MQDTGRGRRQRVPLAVLLCVLVLLAFAERRLAYLDFNSDGGVRISNNEKPDGDEILNRLVFVDDTTEAVAPKVGDACHAAVIPIDSCARSLTTVRLSASRAPPLVLPSTV